MKVTKSSGGVPRLSYTGRDDRHFLPTGLYIIKTVNGMCFSHLVLFLLTKLSEPVGCVITWIVCVLSSEPWTMAYSKNSMKKFFFNKLTKESTYDMPPNAAAPFQYVSSFLRNLFLNRSCPESNFSFPQCLPLWAFLLGLGGWSDRPRFTDKDGPWEAIQEWYYVLCPPELPALKRLQRYWAPPAAT